MAGGTVRPSVRRVMSSRGGATTRASWGMASLWRSGWRACCAYSAMMGMGGALHHPPFHAPRATAPPRHPCACTVHYCTWHCVCQAHAGAGREAGRLWPSLHCGAHVAWRGLRVGAAGRGELARAHRARGTTARGGRAAGMRPGALSGGHGRHGDAARGVVEAAVGAQPSMRTLCIPSIRLAHGAVVHAAGSAAAERSADAGSE